MLEYQYWIYEQTEFVYFGDLQNERKDEMDYQIKNKENFNVFFACYISLPSNTNGFIKITIICECTIYKYNIEFGGQYERGDW